MSDDQQQTGEKRSRTSGLSTTQLHALDHACWLIHQAFGDPPYLVGSVMGSGPWRDVDVRSMLSDDDFDRLFPDKQVWSLFCFTVSQWLSSETGLPIDYQVQRTSIANEHHDGPRNPLGMHRIFAGGGDATDWEPGSRSTTRAARKEVAEARSTPDRHPYTVDTVLVGAEPYPCVVCGQGREAHTDPTIGDKP